jgi:putative transposase
VSDKFEFIDAEYAASTSTNTTKAPSIIKMCAWLEVSRSGFYEWRDRPASATARRRENLKLIIKTSFDDSDDTYGHRRVHADLADWGVPCGPELVRALMRELGLEPCQPRPWRHCLTEADGQAGPIPDLVNRDFTADAPGQKMVGDITYISTWEGWIYLATVIDCHTKAVIGWAMADHYKTPLIEAAIEMAARNHRLAEDAMALWVRARARWTSIPRIRPVRSVVPAPSRAMTRRAVRPPMMAPMAPAVSSIA